MRQRKGKGRQESATRARPRVRPTPARPLAAKVAASALQLADPPQFEGRSADGHRIMGALVAIVDRTVEGWALNVQDPTTPVTVDIFDGEVLLGSAVAFMFRPELSAAGIGNGNHYFQFALPNTLFDGSAHLISARPTGSAAAPQSLGAKRTADAAMGPEPGRPSQAFAVGMLENVSEDGWVKGWAWYPTLPGKRVEVEVLVDGEVAGETLAATHRADLLAAGIGDGHCSFAFGLPEQVLRRTKACLVSVRDKRTGRAIAEPRLFERREIADALEKLTDLENDARLLNSTVALAAARAAADKRAAADLFTTVGEFFLQLASVTAAGKPPGSLQTLRAAIDGVIGRFPAIEFRMPAQPKLSICVEATGSLEGIYNTLRSISRFHSDVAAEVLLYHSGACDEAALLPLIARNLRYLHAEDGVGAIACRNRVAAFARGDILIFLAGGAEPASDWLAAISSLFKAQKRVALIGAKIVRPDGVLESAGISLSNRRPEAIGLGADPSAASFSRPGPIDAVASEAFAVRRDAWQRSRGLDESLASIEPALLDLCARTGGAQGAILYEPKFEVILRR